MSKQPKKPADSLVQELLAERRELKVMLERVRMDLDEARAGANGPDPRVNALEGEIERLRHQLATSRAEVGLLREERDELRQGIEKAMAQISQK